ncbi:MAG: apolipoprotein N-acyltransferase [Bacteroidota bacterium]|nr:apolipoprotein N-acyltransferase [Chlorobiota bacterium]MDW8272133.1 apolipoprotein N-acyltransferase [Bacteroidota bacterium]
MERIGDTPGTGFVWRYRWALALISGAALGMAYPPTIAGPVAWIAFVPVLAMLDMANVRQRRWFGLVYLFGWAWHGAANWWVMSWQPETDPYLMVAGAMLWLVHPLFLIPSLVLYAILRRQGMRRSMALVFFCMATVAVEWLHSLGDLSYPWLALGYTQLRSMALAQMADLTGVWGLSMIVVALNAVVYGWIARRLEHKQPTRVPLRDALQLAAAMFAVLALPLGYGILRLMEYTPSPGVPLRVGIVQPNINPWRKWSYADMAPMLDAHLALQDSLQRSAPLDLGVWSETALPVNLFDAHGAALLARIRAWCDSTGCAVLTGFADIERYKPLRAYNAAVLIAPHVEQFHRHRKSRLTPFGEYMPFSDALPELAKALQWSVGISSWAKGPGATALPLVEGADTVARLGVMICIESIYPDFAAECVRRGADVLVVITNDAWYDGTPGPDQHFAIAQMRAIETRRPIVRCANSGISGFIAPTGSVLVRAPARVATAIAATVVPQSECTVYVQWGDWFPIGMLAGSAAILLWWGVRRYRGQAAIYSSR